ncbi:MAG: hemolysin III family protein [Hylemonella sp.]|nr:hemolysin III family protein [Hylemonella sp.]
MLPASTKREQSRAEEIANSVSHGLGLGAALVGVPILIVDTARRADAALMVGVSVFCATVLTLYLASAIYHALPAGRLKRIFRVLDHASIFLLIAGTYAPFTLGVLRGPWGWTLFGVLWGLAIVGVMSKIIGRTSRPILSTVLYLVMGWLVVVAVDPLVTRMPLAGLLWLLAGGVFYTAGVAFFAFDSRLRYGHLIWHLFVMSGTVCHYLAVFWYAA